MYRFSFKSVNLLLGVLVLLTSCLEVKEDDRYPYTQDELMGAWETEIPLHQDEWTGITGEDLQANNQATIHLVDMSGAHEYTGSWEASGTQDLKVMEFSYDLKIEYTDPEMTRIHLGNVYVKDDQLVFSSSKLTLHKQE